MIYIFGGDIGVLPQGLIGALQLETCPKSFLFPLFLG
jgi:hypothetical protein